LAESRQRRWSHRPAGRPKRAAIAGCPHFSAKPIASPEPDITVYDLSQNISGRPVLGAKGAAGSSIKLLPGELLDSAGRVSQKSSGSPVYFQYTLRDGEQNWHPQFTYSGFRYLEAHAPPGAVQSLSAQFIHSSAPMVGEFSCSNPLLNQIHDLINAAILSNMQSVLTDCPHREKLGWLEQSHLMGPAIMFNYDVATLYGKICSDMRDAQHPDGCVPTIAPEYVVFKDKYADFSNSPEWGSAAVINPWLMFQQYGDRRFLEENYEMMRLYVEYLHRREDAGIIDFGLGDWYDIGPGEPGYSKLTSKSLTATAIYYRDLTILRRTARLLNDPNTAERCAAFCENVRASFNKKFLNPDTGQYDTASQTANAMPLAIGLVDPSHRPQVLENLIRDIRARENHITAGDIGFRFVVDALANAGRSDVIYDLLCRTDSPSYGFQLRQGATTLTEAWDANPKNSQNHLMLGHAESWFYEHLTGIHLDLSRSAPKQIEIKPAIVPGLEWAQASHQSVLGKIASRWERDGDSLKLAIQIPFNAAATLHIPTTDAGSIVENGQAFSHSPGVRLVKTAEKEAIFEVGSGSFVVN
jgi:alpha-L-rhamnosidase